MKSQAMQGRVTRGALLLLAQVAPAALIVHCIVEARFDWESALALSAGIPLQVAYTVVLVRGFLDCQQCLAHSARSEGEILEIKGQVRWHAGVAGAASSTFVMWLAANWVHGFNDTEGHGLLELFAYA